MISTSFLNNKEFQSKTILLINLVYYTILWVKNSYIFLLLYQIHMMVNKTDNHCINFINIIFDENIFHIKPEQKFWFFIQYKIIDNKDIFTINIKYII